MDATNRTNSINDLDNQSFFEAVQNIRLYVTSNRDYDSVDKLRILFKHLQTIVATNVDEKRKSQLNQMLVHSCAICAQLFYLRYDENKSYEVYSAHVTESLIKLVESSFTPELRKMQISLGFVDIIAELLMLEMDAFGCRIDFHPSSRNIRRAIGNLLINLTYKHKESKQRLCINSSFLNYVTKIISDVPSLSQHYGGLIRNLSWNADDLMARSLMQTVPALIKASLQAYKNDDRKCLLALLSALWNLAPHSVENKKQMCENNEFLLMLLQLLTDNPQCAVLVESASGILKYLCSCIRKHNRLHKFVFSKGIVNKLLSLLNSSTFTIVLNSLGSLSFLTMNDPSLQSILVNNVYAVKVINQLKNSAREDVSNSARDLWNRLHDTTMIASSPSTTASLARSVTGPYSDVIRDDSTLCNYESQTLHGYRHHQRQNDYENTLGGSDLRPYDTSTMAGKAQIVYNTLPKSGELAHKRLRNKDQQPTSSRNYVENFYRPSANDVDFHQRGDRVEDDYETFIKEPCIEAGQDLTESMQGTRSGSVESLNSVQVSTEWPSTIATSTNSGNQSPASASDLPASPSQCATHAAFQAALGRGNVPLAGPVSMNVLTPTGSAGHNKNSNGVFLEFLRQDVFDLQFPDAECSRTCSTDNADDNLLSAMINTVLPKPGAPNNRSRDNEKFEGKDDNLLNESIASMMPGRPAAMPMSPNKPVGSGTAASNNLSYMDNTANCSQSGIDWDEDSRLEPLEEEERNFDDDIDFGSVLRADIKVSSGNSVAGGGDCSSDEFLNLFTVVSKSVDRAGYDDIGNSNYSGTKKFSLLENQKFVKEKVRDVSSIRSERSGKGGCGSMGLFAGDIPTHMGLSSSSDDNYNFPDSSSATVDPHLPEDVAAEFRAERVIINCRSVTSVSINNTLTKQSAKSTQSTTKNLCNSGSIRASAIPRKSMTTPSSCRNMNDVHKTRSGEITAPNRILTTTSTPTKKNASYYGRHATSQHTLSAQNLSSVLVKPPPAISPKPTRLAAGSTSVKQQASYAKSSARVSPFNYRKPNTEKKDASKVGHPPKTENNKQKSVDKGAKNSSSPKDQLIVTIV